MFKIWVSTTVTARFLHDQTKPLVWLKNGEYIGDSDDFKIYAKDKFGVELDSSEDELKEYAKENKVHSEWLKFQEVRRDMFLGNKKE